MVRRQICLTEKDADSVVKLASTVHEAAEKLLAVALRECLEEILHGAAGRKRNFFIIATGRGSHESQVVNLQCHFSVPLTLPSPQRGEGKI